mgnify:CR=1 FL=1
MLFCGLAVLRVHLTNNNEEEKKTMLRRRVVLPCLLLVVGAMGAVSCGGGGGSASPTAPTLTATTTSTTTATTSSLGVCGISAMAASVTPTFEVITIPTGDPLAEAATKCIRVFGVMVMANKVGVDITDAKLKHAATIAAEWLDNNEDGIVDDSAVNNSLLERTATVVVINGSDDLHFFMVRAGWLVQQNAQEVGVLEMAPDNCKGCGAWRKFPVNSRHLPGQRVVHL